MNKRLLSLLCIFSAAAFVAAGEFRLPTPEVFTLDNGLTVLYHQDAAVPTVSFHALIRGAGLAAEPTGRDGVADIAADLILKGCGGLKAEAVAEEIDAMGASLSAGTDAETAVVTGRCLREYFPRLLEIATLALKSPDFPAEEFTRERDRRSESLKAVKDEARSALAPYFMRRYFGAHPLGRYALGTENSLRTMTVEDVKAFHQSCYRADRMILAVVGDIRPEELKTALGRTLGSWKSPAAKTPSGILPEFPTPVGKKVLLIDKPDLNQSFFQLGAPGYPFGDPLEPAAEVFNTLFGDRFTSWLNAELRIKRGLTYGAHSFLQSWGNGGLFTISSYTRNEDLATMLDITFGLMKKARAAGFTATDVESARNYIRGQFPLSLESGPSKAAAYAALYFYGKGWDYYGRYLAGVSAVKPPEAATAAQRLVPAEDYVLVVIGKAAVVKPALEKYGLVEVRSIAEAGF